MLFMDNCRVHHSKKVKKHLSELGVTPIFNVPYSPQFNPIEKYWAMVKMYFKRMKLGAIQQGASVNHRDLVRQSLLNIDNEAIKTLSSRVCASKIMKLGEESQQN